MADVEMRGLRSFAIIAMYLGATNAHAQSDVYSSSDRASDYKNADAHARCDSLKLKARGYRVWKRVPGTTSECYWLKRATTAADCVSEPSASQRRQLRQTGMGLVETMAAMGKQTDHFLDSMGQAVVSQLAYLSQPNQKLWDQRAEASADAIVGIVKFINNNNAERLETLREIADGAVTTVQRDPAGFLGAASVDVLVGRTTGAAGKLCRVTARRVAPKLPGHAATVNAAERLKRLIYARTRFEGDFGTGCDVNPGGRINSCVQSSWADELNDEIGSPQFTAENLIWHPQVDSPTSSSHISRIQKQMWGDRRFADHSPERALLQSQGIPALMPGGVQDVIREYQTAGPGAHGFVYARWDNAPAGHPGGHVLRVANRGGVVKFRDSALDQGGSFNFDPNGPLGSPSRVYTYRTRGGEAIQ